MLVIVGDHVSNACSYSGGDPEGTESDNGESSKQC